MKFNLMRQMVLVVTLFMQYNVEFCHGHTMDQMMTQSQVLSITKKLKTLHYKGANDLLEVTVSIDPDDALDYYLYSGDGNTFHLSNLQSIDNGTRNQITIWTTKKRMVLIGVHPKSNEKCRSLVYENSFEGFLEFLKELFGEPLFWTVIILVCSCPLCCIGCCVGVCIHAKRRRRRQRENANLYMQNTNMNSYMVGNGFSIQTVDMNDLDSNLHAQSAGATNVQMGNV